MQFFLSLREKPVLSDLFLQESGYFPMSTWQRVPFWIDQLAAFFSWFYFVVLPFSEQGRSSVHPVAEQPGGHGKGHGGDDRHRPKVMPEIFQSRSFEKNPPDDGEKITHRIEIGQGLHEVRHVGDRC